MNALTVSEQGRLTEMETIIDRGLQTFYEVGKALTTIRDEQLYRVGYATFEDYCEEKWQMSRAYAYRTIGAADVVKSLSPIGDKPLPANEAQARPLTSLEPEQRQQAWAKAVEESDGKPTARQVQAAADEVSGKVRNLAEGIRANVSESAYESVRSLQGAVLAHHNRVCANRRDVIASLETLKADPQSAGWNPLSMFLVRQGKVFRVGDLRQAVNNALDSMRFMAGQTVVSQPSEPAQELDHTATCPMCSGQCEVKGTYRGESAERLVTLDLYCPTCRASMRFGRNYPHDPIDWMNPTLLNIKWGDDVKAPLPPDGYKPYSRRTGKCPHCKVSPGRSYGPAIWMDPIVKQWQAEFEARDEAWREKKWANVTGFQEPRPTDIRIRDHWSIVRPGECDCGARYWEDFRGNSFYLPPQPDTEPTPAPVPDGEQPEPQPTPDFVEDHAPELEAAIEAITHPAPSDMMLATHALRVNIESIPVTIRRELAQEFRWWSDDDKRKLPGLQGDRRDVCYQRSILLVTVANLLEIGL